MVKRVNNVPLLINDADELVGTQDFNDGEERFMVFEGEPTNSIAFDTTPDTTRSLAIGECRWNVTDGTLDLKLNDNVTLQIGQEQGQKFRNNGSVDMVDGQAVYITGSTGSKATIQLAQANSESASAVIIGVVTEPIAKNTEGYVTTFGLVRDLDTSHLTEGAAVWLSPTVAGGLTSTQPVAPNHLVLVGYCIRSHPNLGSIFVKPQNGYELGELHDVLISNPQNGQVLKYNASAGYWYNANP